MSKEEKTPMEEIIEKYIRKKNYKTKKMKEEDKIKIKLARLQGEYIGTLKGILWWDIPNKLKEKLKDRIVELENQNPDE